VRFHDLQAFIGGDRPSIADFRFTAAEEWTPRRLALPLRESLHLPLPDEDISIRGCVGRPLAEVDRVALEVAHFLKQLAVGQRRGESLRLRRGRPPKRDPVRQSRASEHVNQRTSIDQDACFSTARKGHGEAEGEGFEPSTGLRPVTVFETAASRMAAIGTLLEHIAGGCGLLRTSTDSAIAHDFRICREIAESAGRTRLTRNEGVPGSSPGVGFLRFAGIVWSDRSRLMRGSGLEASHL
jgi:hypothetical protein